MTMSAPSDADAISCGERPTVGGNRLYRYCARHLAAVESAGGTVYRDARRAVGASAITLTGAHSDGVVERMLAGERVGLGPDMWLRVDGPAQQGRTLTVVLNGRTVELEVAKGETAKQVARRLADALNAGSTRRAADVPRVTPRPLARRMPGRGSSG